MLSRLIAVLPTLLRPNIINIILVLLVSLLFMATTLMSIIIMLDIAVVSLRLLVSFTA